MSGAWKFNEKIAKQIVGWVGHGNTFIDACAAVGVTARAARYWMEWGAAENVRIEKGDKPDPAQAKYKRFCDAVNSAMLAPKTNAIKCVTREAKKDALIALKYLEQRWPKEWGRRINITIQEELEATLRALEEGLTQDEYAKVLRIIDGRAGSETLGTAAGHAED